MTFPTSFVIAMKSMRTIFCRKLTLLLQYVKYGCKVLNIKATTHAKFKRFLKLAGINNLVHESTKYLFDQILRILGMINFTFFNIIQAFFNSCFAMASKGPSHLFR